MFLPRSASHPLFIVQKKFKFAAEESEREAVLYAKVVEGVLNCVLPNNVVGPGGIEFFFTF